jgi:hypothetical protein
MYGLTIRLACAQKTQNVYSSAARKANYIRPPTIAI